MVPIARGSSGTRIHQRWRIRQGQVAISQGPRPRIRWFNSQSAVRLLSNRRSDSASANGSQWTSICSAERCSCPVTYRTPKAYSGTTKRSARQPRLSRKHVTRIDAVVSRDRNGASGEIPASSNASRLAASSGVSSSSPPPAMPCQHAMSDRWKTANSQSPARVGRYGITRT